MSVRQPGYLDSCSTSRTYREHADCKLHREAPLGGSLDGLLLLAAERVLQPAYRYPRSQHDSVACDSGNLLSAISGSAALVSITMPTWLVQLAVLAATWRNG
jgi:hypothetical protein